ncbi:hypothetical protein [Sphingorhabdus sp.]|uniref:hypothetical protein n=1 Tax=Sphingorhabdus sp. TaxID=1902408 RepID=UPI003919E29E
MITNASGSLSSLPNGRIVDFECAEIRAVPFQDSLYLWVTGPHPGPDMHVRLAPRYYSDRPDYWAIEVAAIRPMMLSTGTADEMATFECAIPLVGVTGIRGITVIGANRLQRIEIAETPAA